MHPVLVDGREKVGRTERGWAERTWGACSVRPRQDKTRFAGANNGPACLCRLANSPFRLRGNLAVTSSILDFGGVNVEKLGINL